PGAQVRRHEGSSGNGCGRTGGLRQESTAGHERSGQAIHGDMISWPAHVMLNDTLYRVRRIEGLQNLQKRGEGGARELTSSRLRLPAGGTHRYHLAGEETVIVLLDGRGTFKTP